MLLECENAVVLSFDVATLSVQNLVVTFEHPHSTSLVTGISCCSVVVLNLIILVTVSTAVCLL